MNKLTNNLDFNLLMMLNDDQLLISNEMSDKKAHMDKLRRQYMSQLDNKNEIPKILEKFLEQKKEGGRADQIEVIRNHLKNFIGSFDCSDDLLIDIGYAFVEGFACAIDEISKNISAKKIEQLFEDMTFDCYLVFKEFEEDIEQNSSRT